MRRKRRRWRRRRGGERLGVEDGVSWVTRTGWFPLQAYLCQPPGQPGPEVGRHLLLPGHKGLHQRVLLGQQPSLEGTRGTLIPPSLNGVLVEGLHLVPIPDVSEGLVACVQGGKKKVSWWEGCLAAAVVHA